MWDNYPFFFFEKQTHTHTRERERSSNTKTHHKIAYKLVSNADRVMPWLLGRTKDFKLAEAKV